MPHPPMYDDDDPVLARLRKVCLALPGAAEKISHGHPTFFCAPKGKVFAVYGGSIKRSPGDHERHQRSLLFKPDPVELPALEEDERFWSPAYYGPSGWRGVDLAVGERPATSWEEVAELVDASYRQVAPRSLVAELQARGNGADRGSAG